MGCARLTSASFEFAARLCGQCVAQVAQALFACVEAMQRVRDDAWRDALRENGTVSWHRQRAQHGHGRRVRG